MSAEAPEMTPEKAFFSAVYSTMPDGYPDDPSPEQAALAYVAARVIGFEEARIYFDDFADTELGSIFGYCNLGPTDKNKRFDDDQIMMLANDFDLLDGNLKLAIAPMIRADERRVRLLSDVFISEPTGETKNRAYEALLENATKKVNVMTPSFERLIQRKFVTNLHRAHNHIVETIEDLATRKELTDPITDLMNRVEAIFPSITKDALGDLSGGGYKGDRMTLSGRASDVLFRTVETVVISEDSEIL